MKAHRIFYVVIFSTLLSACASTGNSYFKQATFKEPHAVLKFEMGEKVGLLLDVRVAKVIPRSINGMPVNSWVQGWKLRAYEKFLIPSGDTIVFLSYMDRDMSAYEYVRFDAQQGEVYKVTYAKEEMVSGFRVTSSNLYSLKSADNQSALFLLCPFGTKVFGSFEVPMCFSEC